MSTWLNVLFPPRCILCGTRLSVAGEQMLCANCTADISSYRVTNTLKVAGTDGAASALQYKDRVRYAMRRYKFLHCKSNAKWFASCTATVLADKLADWQPDYLTYVPLGWFRMHQRGYNQSELIARFVAEKLGLPCGPTLCKRVFAKKQSVQGRKARLLNAKRAFVLQKNVLLTGKRVVIIDDILTTGATLAACAALLRQAGASYVFALTTAWTPPKRLLS